MLEVILYALLELTDWCYSTLVQTKINTIEWQIKISLVHAYAQVHKELIILIVLSGAVHITCPTPQ
jgi:hypothetical protein